MMRDGRALQAGTSHYMGTSFAKAFGIQYTAENGGLALCHTTSWGMTTRMIGGVIMTHGDDKGLVLPPLLAPYQVVIVPIGRGQQGDRVLPPARELADLLRQAGIRTHLDDRPQLSPGFKFNYWEMRGVPVRLELGPRDLAARTRRGFSLPPSAFIGYRRWAMNDTAQPLDRATAAEFASWFKALADPTRIQIVSLLARRGAPMNVGEIVAAVDVVQSTVSAHLKVLAEVRFLLSQRRGTATYYRVNDACVDCFPTAADIVMGRPAPVSVQP
jgi:DNA-binding transcriptional ArsR family regulator